MKLSILAAAAIAMTGAVPGVAMAQRHVVHERTVVRSGPERHPAVVRQSCHWEQRHHHRVRICRTVRHR